MKLHHKILATAILLTGCCGALSADDGITIISGGQGENRSFTYSQVEKITFADGKMNVVNPDGSVSFDLNDIASIRFDLEVSSTDDVRNSIGSDISITGRDGLYHVASADGNEIAISVYNLEGMNVLSASGLGQCDLDLRDKPAGIYIIKINDKTVKLRKL